MKQLELARLGIASEALATDHPGEEQQPRFLHRGLRSVTLPSAL
jgi:hypothetical protein